MSLIKYFYVKTIIKNNFTKVCYDIFKKKLGLLTISYLTLFNSHLEQTKNKFLLLFLFTHVSFWKMRS